MITTISWKKSLFGHKKGEAWCTAYSYTMHVVIPVECRGHH